MAQATIGALRVVLGLDSANFTKGLARAQSRLKRTGQNFQRIGRSMTLAITAPIALIGVAILRSAGNFEAGMARMRAVLRPTGAEFEKLRDLAAELGRTTQFTATQAAGAMEVLAKNGLKATQILEGATDATLNFAAASGGDLAQAADVITDLMINFNLATSDMARVVDNATGTLLTSKITFEEYVGAVGQAAGASGGLGVSLEDMNAAISLTASAFASGTDAGTSFKGFLLRLVPAGEKGKKIIKELGLEFFTTSGEIKDLAGIAETLKTSLAGLTTESKIESLAAIFGQRTIRTALRLAEEGAEGVRKRLEEIADVDAATVAADRLKSFEGALKLLKSALEGLAIAIADSGLLKWVTDLAKSLTEMVRSLAEASPALLKWGTIIAGLTAVIGPFLVVLGIMVTGIAALGPVAIALGVALRFALGPLGLLSILVVAVVQTLRRALEIFGLTSKATNVLETATDNVVTAMGDEITQSQMLSGVLATATTMSLEAAKAKRDEAAARLANANAAILEARALVVDGEGFKSLTAQIGDFRSAISAKIVGASDDITKKQQDALEGLQATLADLLVARQAFFESPALDALGELSKRAKANLAILDAAIATTKAGIVTFNDTLVEPIKATKRLAEGSGDAAKETERLKQVFKDIAATLQEDAASLKLRADMIGLNTKEAAELFAITTALNDAVREGLDLTPKQIEQLKKLAAGVGEAAEELRRKFEEENAIQGIADDITGPFRDALKEGEISFKSFADAIIDIAERLQNRLIDEIFDDIADALADSLRGDGKSGGGLFGSILTGILGAAGGGAAGGGISGSSSGFAGAAGGGFGGAFAGGGFAHGGSFIVGGSAGVDKNVVSFRASRGERVDITPANDIGGSEGVVVQLTNNFSLDAVQVRSQIEAATPSIVQAAKLGVADAMQRGGRFKKAMR